MSPHQVFEPAVSAGLLPHAKISGYFIMFLSGVLSCWDLKAQHLQGQGAVGTCCWSVLAPVGWLDMIPNQICL